MNADRELLRLLRAVKAHGPREDAEDNGSDAFYSHAFDDDDVLLCLNALQAATETKTWRVSPVVAELVNELLDWDVTDLQIKRSTTNSLLAVRWRFIARAIREGTIAETDNEDVIAKLRARVEGDRFAAIEVQYEVADCLVSAVRSAKWNCDSWTLELVKQLYVTLPSPDVRKQLGDVVRTLTASKDDVKVVVRVGLYRAIVQVGLDQAKAHYVNSSVPPDKDRESSQLMELLSTATSVLRQAAERVCANRSNVSSPDVAINLCEVVVHLLLSRVIVVCEEAVRMLQMLVESPRFLCVLPSLPDLRGALEKAKVLACLPDGRLAISDPYVRSLCEHLHALLIPQIDKYEKLHGSLVGLTDLMEIESCSTFEQSLDAVLNCKSRGNAFYQRGNFPTARLFYRRAIAIIKATEFQAEQTLAFMPLDLIKRRCTIGASVYVTQINGSLRGAIISDVGDDAVEVLYDEYEEEEIHVRFGRLRLRLDTKQLAQLKTVEVDCAMNMAKSFSMMHDQPSALKCYTHVLLIQPHYIAARYLRGVAHLVLHDLKQAQEDLWQANDLCRKWITSGPTEPRKRKILHEQIVAAYKKLQVLHSSKKKVDKKVIKQVLRYIATIPGLENEVV